MLKVYNFRIKSGIGKWSIATLYKREKTFLSHIVQLYEYSCGSILLDLKTMDNRTPRINLLLEKVFVRKNLTCISAVEVPYFSAKCFVNVCFHCGGVDRLKIEEGSYPVCGSCAEKSEN